MISHSYKISFLSFTRHHLAFLACLTIYLFLKSKCFHWYISDESIYYYMARDLGWSFLPYRDFFYANPPLLLFLLKLSGILTGWGIAGLRVVPILCHVLAGYAFYRILSLRLKWMVIIPLSIFWLSYDSLRASTHATGISETLAFLGGAFLLSFRGKPALAGLCLGLGLWTKTYAITGLPAVLVILWLNEPDTRVWLRNMGWSLGVMVLMVVLLAVTGTLLGGQNFWDMNVFYHLSKQPTESGALSVFGQVWIRNQGSLYTLAATVLLWVIGWFISNRNQASHSPCVDDGSTDLTGRLPINEQWRYVIVGVVHFLAVLVFLGMQRRIFDFYLLLFLPALALVSGGFLGMALKRWSHAPTQGRRSALRKVCWVAYFVLSLAFLVHPMVPRQYRLFMRELVTYWQHEERTADELGKWKDLLTGENVVLAGDSGTAPIVALLSHQKLALGEADTNQMRFQGGFPSSEVYIQELKDAGVQWLIVRGRRTSKGRFIAGGMFSLPEFKAYAQTDFSQVDRLLLEGDTEVRLMRSHGGLMKADTATW